MDVINEKINLLKKHIYQLNKCEVYLLSDDYGKIIEEAEEIVKLAAFLKEYRSLDKQRMKNVKEVALNYLNENDTYDSSFLKTLDSCFED